MSIYQSDIAFEKEEKEITYQQLCSDVSNAFKETEKLNLQIIDIQRQLTIARMQNIVLKSRSTISTPLPKNEISDKTYEINTEHKAILKEKLNNFKPVKEEIDRLAASKESIEEDIVYAVETVKDKAKENISLKNKLHLTQNEVDSTNTDINILQKQLIEQRLRIQKLNQLKSEGEAAYQKLEKRAEEIESAQGGRLDCIKQISILQTQASELTDKITKIKEHNYAIIAEREEADKKFNKESENHKQAVNWEAEKNELKEELKLLKEQIKQKTEEVTSQEKKQNTDANKVKRYGSFVKKWEKKLATQELPNKTISQLWEEYEKTKDECDKHKKDIENQMTNITAVNAKLKEDIQKKKQKTSSLIQQFRVEEKSITSKSDMLQIDAQKQEEDLIHKITEIRLKLAEKEQNANF